MPKFSPRRPFSLFREGSNFGNKSKDSAFLGGLMREHIDFSGVVCHVYRFTGPIPQTRDAAGVHRDTQGSTYEPTDIGSFMGVQDPVLGENRDRNWNFDEIPRIKGAYQVSQYELEYLRFGASISNDVLTMEFHAEEMERQCGRRLILGDVIELPHLREVGIDGRVANKWYEVAGITWSTTGYDPKYIRHILGVVLKPLRYQQEFLAIFDQKDQYGKTLEEQATNRDALLKINQAVQEFAGDQVRTTMFDNSLMWLDPSDPDRKPDLYTDDGKPDNGMVPVGQGPAFPPNPVEGDWFVRSDFEPVRLYRYNGQKWSFREHGRKREWIVFNWLQKQREFMSDRSDADRARNWDLRSIHDVLTEREERSDPTGDELEKKK